MKEKNDQESRVGDSQYDPPSAGPLEHELGPTLDEDDIAWLNAPMGPVGSSVQEKAHAYLSRLLVRHAPQCEPLPDLMGLCTQIDNLLTGLRSDTSGGNQLPSGLRGDPGAPRTVNAPSRE